MTSWLARYQTYVRGERAQLRKAAGRGRPEPVGPEDASWLAVVAPAGRGLFDAEVEAALRKAFTALGADFGAVRVVPTTRDGEEPGLGWPRILAWEIELTDPGLILALGDEAAAALGRAWPGGGPPGRRVVAIPDPARALRDPKGKRALWDALKSVAAALPQV
jgi:hypothetical protein